jgi:hypothetical protein
MPGSSNALADLALFELPARFVEPALRTLRFANTALDTLFYDTGVLATELLWRGEVVTTQTARFAVQTEKAPIEGPSFTKLDLGALTNPEELHSCRRLRQGAVCHPLRPGGRLHCLDKGIRQRSEGSDHYRRRQFGSRISRVCMERLHGSGQSCGCHRARLRGCGRRQPGVGRLVRVWLA